MNTKEYGLKVTFTESVLGTQPQKDVATEFITSKAVDENGNLPEDELMRLPEALEKGTTAFFHDPTTGAPLMCDYQIKAFLKETGRTFNGLRGVKNLRNKIDNLVFVEPRWVELHLPDGGKITYCERPLRAETAQGPRTGLARSEELPAGTWFECKVVVYDGGNISEPLLRDLLDYGKRKGYLQWRNGGHGRFVYELDAL